MAVFKAGIDEDLCNIHAKTALKIKADPNACMS
jgi:hypothetical protein